MTDNCIDHTAISVGSTVLDAKNVAYVVVKIADNDELLLAPVKGSRWVKADSVTWHS